MNRIPPRFPSLRFSWPACLAAALVAIGSFSAGAADAAVAPSDAGLQRALAEQHRLALERPGDASVLDDLGHLLSMQGDLAGAEAAYREAIVLDPASPSPHFHLGVLLERLDKPKAALKEYKIAIELEPDHAWALYEAGSVYDQWGHDSRAKRYYGEALMLDPTLNDPVANPHILENRLATQAMIYGYRKYPQAISAPARFHEPARIAALMIDAPATPPTEALAEEPESASPANTSGGYARVTSSQGDRGGETREARADESEKVEPARTLSTRDLEAGKTTGQVSGGGAAGAVVGRSGKEASEESKAGPKARDANRPPSSRPAAAPRTGSGSSVGPARPKAGGSANGGGSGGSSTPFIPSPDSTGRLEVTLEPVAKS